MKIKVIIGIVVIALLSAGFFYVKYLNQTIDNKSIIIQELTDKQKELTDTIKNNNDLFEKYKEDTAKNIQDLQELTKKNNTTENKSVEKIKEALTLDYKKEDKKILKEKINKQYNDTIGELNDI